jgi:predicted  nucleic acid-binding Zn-ribbon protein
MSLAVASAVWAAVATIGALGAAFVRWRSDSDETTALLWKEEAEAWKAKAERLESALASLEKRVDLLEQENHVLRAMHDSRDEMAALRTAVIEGFADLRALVESNWGEISK